MQITTVHRIIMLTSKSAHHGLSLGRPYKAIQGYTRLKKAIQGHTRLYKAIEGYTRPYKLSLIHI